MKKFIALLIALVLCIVPCSALVLSAAQPSTGLDILNDTRYPLSGSFNVDIILNAIQAVADSEIISPVNNYSPDDFPKTVATNAYYELNGKPTGYEIKDIYACMAKRKIVYPVGGKEEVQYLYVYINGNAMSTPQQFGDYTIAPNTLFMVRQTNFMGTLAYSIPIVENNIGVLFGNSGKPCVLSIPANMNFTMYTAEGPEVFYVKTDVSLRIENNSYNTIVNNHLQTVYDYDISHNKNYYEGYLSEGYMDGLEAFLGVGINVTYSEWTTNNWSGYGGDRSNQYPWYVCSFFSNNEAHTGSPSYYSTNNNINPQKPPAIILPSTSPLYSGKTINNENITNYNDFGITNINGELSIDPDILAGALAGLIDPDFKPTFAGVFGLQPEIGLGFDTPLDLNLPDLVDDYLQSITVYPPSEGWEPPSYPAVNTSTYIPATVPSYETYAIRTIPAADLDGTGDWFFFGFDLMDDLGFLVYFIPLAILGLFWRFTGGD